MKTEHAGPRTIDEYIAGFPHDVQVILRRIRLTIRKAAPDAKEVIKYQIPTFTLRGNLVSFAAYQNHIGIYPVPKGTERFQKQVAGYKSAKSTVRLPLDKPVPFELISRLVKFRVRETRGSRVVRRK